VVGTGDHLGGKPDHGRDLARFVVRPRPASAAVAPNDRAVSGAVLPHPALRGNSCWTELKSVSITKMRWQKQRRRKNLICQKGDQYAELG
jgi:hypothetical protein